MYNSIKRFFCTIAICSLIGFSGFSAEIWVSPTGSDVNPGTKEKPLAHIDIALRKARELRRLADPSIAKGITIYLKSGLYQLEETLFIRPEDSGTPSSPTIIQSASENKAILSGGMQVKGWRKAGDVAGLPAAAAGKVWEAEAPLIGDEILNFRQLWVNNSKAVRSKNTQGDLMERILSWNKKDETCWIPKPKAGLSNIKGMEMFIHQWWAIAILRVKAAEVKGDSVKLSFYQPESRVQSEHPWPAPWISKETGNSAFFLSNAIQFLDEPGEWYLDRRSAKIYYWPRQGEIMSSADVRVPALETLVRMQGTIDRPVSNVFVKGISFQHATWLYPSKNGLVPHQAGMYILDAYKLKIPGTPEKKSLENQAWVGRPASAVEVSYANNTAFENCRFEHTASTGLDYKVGTNNNKIVGNLFKDIGGTAILVGKFSDEAQEVHLPYNPADEREVCSNELISNNLITDATNEDWGCVGIGTGFVRGIKIHHNDISEVSYSGISMGWGWTKAINAMRDNSIIANRIVRYGKHMYDVAGIYTLSAQPGSVITENCVDSIYKAPYAHDPNHWFYLYTDEGSSYFSVKNNWTTTDKYLQNANGPGNVWENNGPQVADSVRLNAGLEKNYQYLLKDKSKATSSREINHSERFKVVELIDDAGNAHNTAKIKALCQKNEIAGVEIHRWKNHSVIYGRIENPESLRRELLAAFPGNSVKIYNAPFYEFNRKKSCGGNGIVKEWDNIFLTANLVKDSLLQKEYLDYHATQFKKWPEVSQGFCNAQFQQLLIFKNGPQLMLVISIPKGESLDKLNLKTTENNPRVEEWNRVMSKYQEGIPGTKPDETWVFLERTDK
ncbi:L-rhamnose mutarotase [Desertivirga arenae]|uniref:L-rhamnose mutarotase n=1 Tax=Desertivirga arenae TaxID=2810309 RepID=UPI001A972646|nr:L-rhamnose mutarotase [Pedobacter sp. SYSU D00823]